MDKRLPHRVRDVRQKFAAAGRLCDSESVREDLCREFPEYGRVKQKPLRRLIAQELSSPLQPPPSGPGGAPAEEAQGQPQPGDQGQGRGTKRQPSPAAPAAWPNAAPPAVPPETLNGSLRKLYRRGAAGAAGAAGPAGAAPRAAAAAAPNGGFAPEERPAERLRDLGGVEAVLAELRQLVVQPLAHPEVFGHLGVRPPTGVLLHGPPGSGKTKLAHAVAGTTGVPFFKVAATEIVSGMSGESEAKIRQLFQAAIAAAPSLLFMDEVDAITPKRDSAGREMERRIVAQLLTCMDELQGTHVVVLGATNRPDALDPALRRAGRFDREIAMGIPDEAARGHILEKMTAGMRLSGDIDLAHLARLTPGFVGADLAALTQEAALGAVSRAFADLNSLRSGDAADEDEGRPAPYTADEMAPLAVTMDDFQAAVGKVQPSARREGFATIPDVSWEDVGALHEVRSDLDDAICEPIRKAELFKQLGLTTPSGVLLFGPPGCGKTLLAKATAKESGANFIAIKGPELLNKYVGESERAVRLVFQRALSSAPCVIFFDELDALVPRRSAEGSSSAERVVNQMLTEMDGVQQRSQVYVIGATNRPDIVDPAMLRPGRLDRLLFVPFPSDAGRLEILRAHTRRLPLAEDVDLPLLSRRTDGFSGADLAALVREAAMAAIRLADAPPPAAPAAPPAAGAAPPAAAAPTAATEPVAPAAPAVPAGGTGAAGVAGALRLTAALFSTALGRVNPSVGAEERREYEDLAARLRGGVPAARAAPGQPSGGDAGLVGGK